MIKTTLCILALMVVVGAIVAGLAILDQDCRLKGGVLVKTVAWFECVVFVK